MDGLGKAFKSYKRSGEQKKKKKAYFPSVLPKCSCLHDTTHCSLPAVTQSEVVHMLLTLERYISPENEQQMYYSISGRATEQADFWISVFAVLAKQEFLPTQKIKDQAVKRDPVVDEMYTLNLLH